MLSLAVGCLAVFGQPTSRPPATVAATNSPAITAKLDSLPLRTIASLARDWKPGAFKSNDVVHVRGAILDQRVGEQIVIRDETGTISVQSTQALALKMETVVDVWGTPGGDLNRISLRRGMFREISATNLAAANQIAPQKPAQLPTLTRADQIRELPPAQAGWAYPVKLRAVVTLPYQRARTYVQDGAAGLFVRTRENHAALKPGDVVEIEGTSNPGWFVPIVVSSKITVVGTAPLPAPQPVSLFQMANGQYDSQWVEAYAVVRGVQSANGVLQLKLSDRDGTFMANVHTDTTPTNLMDSVIRIRGVCVSQFNNKRQITGVEMWTASADFIQMVEPAVSDALSLPVQPIVGLSQAQMRMGLQRRAKIAGIVTAADPGKSFFVQDADDGIQVFPSDKTTVKPGDRVEVAGYPAPGDYGSVLRDAVIRVQGTGTLPSARPVNEDEPLSPQLNNLLVQVAAQVAGAAETEPEPMLPLQVGSRIFKARILPPVDVKSLPTRGSTVHLTGVYRILADEMRAPRSFQIIVPSDKSLQVSDRASAWTLQHTVLAVGTLTMIACIALLWVLLLRRKVAEQTATLQQSEVKFRSLVEQSLVGVYVIQDGRFTYVNPRMAEIYGYTVEEMLAPAFAVKQTILEEDWPIVDEQIKKRLNREVRSSH
jgi:PAS domain-containing protein